MFETNFKTILSITQYGFFKGSAQMRDNIIANIMAMQHRINRKNGVNDPQYEILQTLRDNIEKQYGAFMHD